MTQTSQILEHLKGGQPLTPIDALTKFGCFRLAARVAELKAEGHQITTEIVSAPDGKRFARYWLK